MPEGRFRCAFIVGAYVPNGGTYMAYHLGKILHEEFGLTAFAVSVGGENPDNGVHTYDLQMGSVSIVEMSATITDRDVLIINPSFSTLLLGWKVPGFKISYVQGFNTYIVLDRKIDHYVAVSDFVAKYLRTVYDIRARVIPAFINLDKLPEVLPWRERPAEVVLPYRKGIENIWDLSYERLLAIVSARAPQIVFKDPTFGGAWMSQQALLAQLGSVRYVLVLSAAEGLGLVPLEAMAMGALVVGYDGFGGRHYFRPGANSAVAPYPEIERVAELLIDAVNSTEKSWAMAERGIKIARQYSYPAFRRRWIEEFSKVLDLPNRNAQQPFLQLGNGWLAGAFRRR